MTFDHDLELYGMIVELGICCNVASPACCTCVGDCRVQGSQGADVCDRVANIFVVEIYFISYS